MDLLERDESLAVLHDALQTAAKGTGSAILLGGRVGIGKIALVRHIANHAGQVWLGACDPLETPRGLTTLSIAIAALRDVAAQDDPNQFDRLGKKYLINATETKGSDRWARLVPGEEDAAAYWTVLTERRP